MATSSVETITARRTVSQNASQFISGSLQFSCLEALLVAPPTPQILKGQFRDGRRLSAPPKPVSSSTTAAPAHACPSLQTPRYKERGRKEARRVRLRRRAALHSPQYEHRRDAGRGSCAGS